MRSLAGVTPGANAARDLAALTALPLRWMGKGARVIAHGLASALDATLRPALIHVALKDPETAETVCAVDGAERDAAGLSAEQWRQRLAAWVDLGPGRVHAIPHPVKSGHLKLVVAGIGSGHGHVALMSAAPVFPEERDLLLLQAACNQAAVTLEYARLAARPYAAAAVRHVSRVQTLGVENELACAVLEGSGDCVLLLDLDGRLLYLSPGGQRALELATIDDRLGAPWSDFWSDTDQDRSRDALSAARDGDVGRFQGYCPTATGRPKWWDVVVTLLRDAAGAPERLLAVARDITEQKLAERALRASEEELRMMFEFATVGVAQIDVETSRVARANPAFCRLLGYAADELAQLSLADIVHPDDRADDDALVRRMALGDLPFFEAEKRYRRKDGATVWTHVAATLVRDAHSWSLRLFLFAHDITARRQAESIERAHQEQLRLVADALPVLIAYVDRDRRYRFANRGFQDWFGYPPAELVGQPVSEVLGPEAYRRIRPWIERALAGERTSYEMPLPFQRGGERFVHACYVPDRGPDGDVRGFFALVQDVTERKRAEQALKESEARYRQLLGLLPAAVYTCDADGRITFYNRRAVELWGREPALHDTDQRFCGAHRLWQPDGRLLPHAQTPMARALTQGESARNREVVIERPDGSRVTVSVNIDPVHDVNGKRTGAINVFEDITERKRVEQALTESEARFRSLADTAPVMIWMTDEHKRSVYFNRRWLEFLGQTLEQALSADWSEDVHPDDRERCLGDWLRAFDARVPFGMDFRMRRHDGAYRWFSDTALPRFDPDGAFRGFIDTMVDITARKELEEERARTLAAERSARAEAELLRDLGAALNSELDISAVLQRVTDAATAAAGAEFGAFFYNSVNEEGEAYALYTLSGAPAEAFAHFPLPRNTALFGPTFRGEAIVRSDDVTQDARYGKSAPHHGMPPGHLPVKSYLAVPVRSRSGEVLGGLFLGHATAGRFEERHERVVAAVAGQAAVAIDNVQLFDAVREQATRLQATYDHAAIGIAEVAPDGRFQRVNDRFCRITGYGREELSRMRSVDITHRDDVSASEAQFRELLAGRIASYQLEKRYLRKGGNAVWVRVTASLVRDDHGPRYSIGVIEDITERRRAEIVIQGQKKALEQMARREPLAAVLATLVETFDDQSMAGGKSMVLLLDGDGRRLRPVALGRLSAGWRENIGDPPNDAEPLPFGAAAFNGQSVFVPDIAGDARWQSRSELARRLGVRAAWSFCLRSRAEQVLGTLDVLYDEPRDPTEEELRFVDLIGDTAAIGIERYRDEASLRVQATVLSQIHDAVVMIDTDERVLRWNEGAERMFGFRTEEALGRPLSSICPDAQSYAWLQENVMAPVAREGRCERVVPLRSRGGRRLYAHMSVSLLRNERGEPSSMVAYMIDVTARVDAERELAARVRQQEAVAKLGQLALSDVVLQSFLDEAVRLTANTLGVELCKVLELLPDGKELLLRAGVGWQAGLVGRGTVSAGRESQAGYTLLSNEPVVVESLPAEKRFDGPRLLHDHGIVSGLSVVIPGASDRPYGVLGAHSTSARHFSVYDVNFLQSVAHILASAIQRRRFEQAMRQARADLERRVEERTAELEHTNQSLRDEVVERMGVESALRESEAQYRMLFERNPVPAWVFDIHTRNILAANETAVWQYGYTREEFLHMSIHDLHPPEEAARALDYAEQFPPETAYIGVWKHRKQDETIIDVEMFVYEVLFQGRWARLMLANDITERRRNEQEFRLLEMITRAVSEARDLDGALYAVLRHICETTGWVLGEAWLPSSDQKRMVLGRAWYCGAEGLDDFRQASWEHEFAPGQSLIGRAWAGGQPVWLPNLTEKESFARVREAEAAGLRAGTAFPVLAEGETVAVLAFFMREPRLEDEHQVKLVSTIGAQVGLAVQRKRAEERLRESEERFRLLVEGAHDYAIFMLDVDGRVASWNRGAERLKGYGPDEIIGQSIAVFHTPEDVARGLPQRALVRARTEGVCEGEGWRVRKNGERFWASVTITALRDAGGTPRGFVKVTRDITERKQAEERLKESEARLVRAQEFSLLMVAHTGLDGRWLKVPSMLCATLAYREEELLAARFEDVTHPDDFPAEWEQCQRLVRGEMKSFDLEKRLLRRDGKIIWVYENTSIVLDAEDRPLHFLTFLRDISQRKEAEEQLRRREIQLSEAQRLAHLGSWEWDVASDRVEWSDELYRIYGAAPDAPVNYETYMARLHPEDRERIHQVIADTLETRQPFTAEERIVRPDGEVRHLLSHGAVVAGTRGEVERLVGVCLDITERKHSEERLREYAHRLQSLSQRLLEAQETERRRIARELHDQIGQDLSVIKINLQALQRLPGATTVGSHLDETLRIVEGVLVTARNLSVELRPSMLDDLGLVAALRWYLDRQAQRAGMVLHFVADNPDLRLPPPIETACFRLAQEALTNILRHAGARHVYVRVKHSADDLEMHIHDDGRGFDVEAARMRATRGESFGLLGMEERALLAGGQLEIISAPKKGTTVIARFPVTLNSMVQTL